MTPFRRTFPLVALLLLLVAPTAARATVAGFDVGSPSGAPFPSDVFTVADPSHLTGVRVNLPKPDCAARPSDCADIDVLNTLDGFNLQPRLSVPFNEPIDPASVSSANVFFVSLGSTTGGTGGKIVGINQAVWEAAANTLHAESDELLDQHTRYVLVVTRGIRDAAGDPVQAGPFTAFLHRQNLSPALAAYRSALLAALAQAGVPVDSVVAASLFTTQTATAVMETIRNQVKSATPAPADFVLGTSGERTVFPLATVTGMLFTRQIGTAPTFTTNPALGGGPMPFLALHLVPGSVSAVAFGSYASPSYLNAAQYIPPYGTATDVPAVLGTNTIYFNLFVPSGPKPLGGWPVAIFGHGFGDNKNNSPFVIGSILASRGIATIAVNVVGHGGGPLGTITVSRAVGGSVKLNAGGRGIDQDGNTTIDSTEGSSAVAPLIGNRDGLRQTVIDLMQLVRVIQVGMDIDGDEVADLDPSRIYYFGQSFGGIYGTKFLAVEPDVHLGVPNVAGGAIIEVARLGGFRPLVALSLGARTPSLLNGGFVGFTENVPLRDDPILIDTYPGASAIQKVLDDTEWVSQAGNPVAYAPYIRKSPLPGMTPKLVIFQFAKGDQTVPNPTTTAIIRAGDLTDRTTYFRNDLAFAVNPTTPKNPHTFLTRITTPSVAAFAIAAQTQIAKFFQTESPMLEDPDGAGPFFEAPIEEDLPEDLNFIP